MKECKHQWEHIIDKGRCMKQDDRKLYSWLIHRCKKCGIKSDGVKLE